MPQPAAARVVAVQSICLAVATVAAFAMAAVTFTQMVAANDAASAAPETTDAPVRIAAVLDTQQPQIVPVINTNEPADAAAETTVVADMDMDMDQPTPQRIFADASPAVVAIVVRDADANVIRRATGFIISSDGMIVTSRKAMAGVHSAAAVLDSNAQLPVTRVVAQDKAADLVLLATDGKNLPHLELSPAGAPAVGSRVYAVAAPPDFDHTIHEAMVSGYRTPTGAPAAAARVRLDSEFDRAAIGAPLLDSDGQVVGVTTSIDTASHATLATPAMVLSDMLEAAASQDDEPAGPIALAFADLATGFADLVAPQPEATNAADRASETLFDANPSSTFAASETPGKPAPLDVPEGADARQLRDRAAAALVPYAGTELEPAERDALELGLRLAAIQEQLESMGPTLQELSARTFEMADAADRIAQRFPDTALGNDALDLKLRASQGAFEARQAARLRDRLDTQHGYERHLAFGGPEGFDTYLRARQVASVPEGWLRKPAWVGSGKGLSVSPPLRVTRSYAPRYYAPPVDDFDSPGDEPDENIPQNAPAQGAPKVLD